ncbi:MAG: S46 family peptidase, partial [Rikenellaceae bacterium]
MKKILVSIFTIFFAVGSAFADEGMWTLPKLQSLNIQDMQNKGLKISAEEIYSINKSSIKDAVVIFGGGCSGEVISDQGLVLTNHHCGYSSIQQHSTVEHDYLKDGFWAMSLNEEIPTPDLSVYFIKEIEDITQEILPKLASHLSEKARQKEINSIINKMTSKETEKASKKYAGASVMIKEFFGGNQYVLFVVQEYKDIRMVGAPPSSIGKFGGDTDNWMWPRHTGDFSLFRIYADKNGNPAPYSSDNKPLKPVKSLTISLAGVKDNDFAMIMGFPGSTQRYMTSWEMAQRTDILNANRIYVRGVRQEILLKDMLADPKVKIQYASKYAGSSNYWKNSIGMNNALAKLNVKADKEKIEADFTSWVNSSDLLKAEYGDALPLIKESVAKMNESVNAIQMISESIFRASEMISFATLFDEMSQDTSMVKNFYKNYNIETDKKVTTAMLNIINAKLDDKYKPQVFTDMIKEYGSVGNVVVKLFGTKIFASKEQLKDYLKSGDAINYKKDRAYILGKAFKDKYEELQKDSTYDVAAENLAKGQRLFIKGLMEMNKDTKVYAPDANFTIRLTYGNVKQYAPRDGVIYDYYTTLGGVMEKEDPANTEEFSVPERLKELYKAKDYGVYANDKGELVVGFIADLDITGGNSGSPVLNDK